VRVREFFDGVDALYSGLTLTPAGTFSQMDGEVVY
jgi:hypothetical protein